MRQAKFSTAALAAIAIAVWPLCAPAVSWAQTEEAAPAGADAVETVPAAVGMSMGFLSLPSVSPLQPGALNVRLPHAVLPALSAEALLGSSELPTAAVSAVQTPRSDTRVTAQNFKRVSAAAVPFESEMTQSDIVVRPSAVAPGGRAAKAEAVVSELEGMSAAAEKGGADQGDMAAASEFDGTRMGRNGRPILTLPGHSVSAESGDDQNSEELRQLREQLFNHVEVLKKSALFAQEPGAKAIFKKQAEEQSALLEKIETSGMPQAVELVALREMANMSGMNPRDSEAQKIKTYLSWLTAVPWSRHTTDRYDLAEAKKIMDRDHSGLEGVKKRILEFLTVRKRTKSNGGGILLFIGPPGVGKTSIAEAIAQAMGRKFVRFSLGGVADETNIRGHNRTYLGSQPGSIIRRMKQAGVNNPVMLLDEVDKMPQDSGRGSAQPAFLEVLDPEQNGTFQDHYMEVPYDLSNVLFIVTANDISGIPPALRDRMEIVEFTGYTTAAKADIIKNQVLPQTAK
ncbi:MAG: AAA family ATPase, partial [Elusimicrobia bacterium]|nr:AAA family ATPase [Elusimicrobiota bacterium]